MQQPPVRERILFSHEDVVSLQLVEPATLEEQMKSWTVTALVAVSLLVGCRSADPLPERPGDARIAAVTEITYPAPPRADVVDDYFGTKVADPFQPLEDATSPETIRWTAEQNALTASLLNRPERDIIKRRLAELFDFTRVSVPIKRGSRYFYSRNDGLQDQPIWYVQEGLNGTPRVVIDPNRLSEDGTAALTSFSVSDDGRLLAYAVSRSGSDRQEVYVRDIDAGRDFSEKLEWVKFTSLAWTSDNKGFFYNRYPVPGTVPAGDEHYFPKLAYHLAGTPQSADRLVYERPQDREVTFGAQVSDDGKYLIVTSYKGSSDDSEVAVTSLPLADKPLFRPLFTGFRHSYVAADVVDDQLYLRTNEGAPRGKVIAVNLRDSSPPRTIVGETTDTLDWAYIADRKLVVDYMHNASTQLRIASLSGDPIGTIELPAVGSVSDLNAKVNEPEMFFSFNSYMHAPTIYRYDLRSRVRSEFARPDAPIDPSQYETTQVWYPSKDGTKVSMFLSHRKGLKLDGNNPVFLYGYGGFNIAYTPTFAPFHFYFMERGGIFAVANLRGGSEYGEEWHRAGMLEKKQNVFDDFAAAAEWLIANKYTRNERIAISGRSNGGLLAAASLVQRPDLFGAVVVQVPVVDMLRYHRFTVARFWIPEYGSSEDPEQFRFLYAYSPLHYVKDGVRYPATLITTAETDDRVDPGQAKKFAARLQEAQGGDEPILIRIESKAGHSSGGLSGAKPVSKLIEEWADIWSFVFWQLGM